MTRTRTTKFARARALAPELTMDCLLLIGGGSVSWYTTTVQPIPALVVSGTLIAAIGAAWLYDDLYRVVTGRFMRDR